MIDYIVWLLGDAPEEEEPEWEEWSKPQMGKRREDGFESDQREKERGMTRFKARAQAGTKPLEQPTDDEEEEQAEEPTVITEWVEPPAVSWGESGQRGQIPQKDKQGTEPVHTADTGRIEQEQTQSPGKASLPWEAARDAAREKTWLEKSIRKQTDTVTDLYHAMEKKRRVAQAVGGESGTKTRASWTETESETQGLDVYTLDRAVQRDARRYDRSFSLL